MQIYWKSKEDIWGLSFSLYVTFNLKLPESFKLKTFLLAPSMNLQFCTPIRIYREVTYRSKEIFI